MVMASLGQDLAQSEQPIQPLEQTLVTAGPLSWEEQGMVTCFLVL